MTVNPNLVQHALGDSDLVDSTEPIRPWWMPAQDLPWDAPLPRSGFFPTAQDKALSEEEDAA